MEKITFCIPSKSNLRYLKTCIPSIRENAFRKDHNIIIFVDSDEDGTEQWLKENKDRYGITYYINPNIGEKLYGIGKAYDYCIEKSTTDIFMVFHADMMLGKNADLNAFKHLKEKTVVCSTRIEPPLHPNAGEKILLDFGIWPEEFNKDGFNSYVESQLNETKYSEGIFAPWMMYKEEFLAIGGHDPILKSAREDSDVFNRLLLGGFTFRQPWNSLVYHLTGRGGQFQHGIVTQDEKQKSKEWQELMNNSTREFIRKWGSNVKHTPLMKPIVPPKYNIGFIVKNCNSQLLEILEPWCSDIYVDCEYKDYVVKEQLNTIIPVEEKVHPIGNNKNNEILVEIDRNTFIQHDFQIIQQLSEIIKDSGEIGKFQLGNLFISIIQMNEYQNDLIKI